MSKPVLPLLDQLRIIAQNGLEYAENPYDEERYDEILDLVADYYGEVGSLSSGEVRARFEERVGHVTPNLGSRAAIIDEQGRILVIKRVGDGTWGLPGGYAEPCETPAETAVREVKEETGLDVEPVDLVTFEYRQPDRKNPHGFVGALYRCRKTGGTLEESHESDGLAFRDLDDVPAWHKDHERVARQAVRTWDGGDESAETWEA